MKNEKLDLTINGDKVNQTFVTTDLTMFKHLYGNRKINMLHVKRLEDSINKHGMLQIDIIVNEKFEVIDGQNRLLAAKNAKSKVYYKICKGYCLDHAVILNTNMVKWKSSDFLDSYAEQGYEEYIKFIKFQNDFPMFSFIVCERILSLKAQRKQETINGQKTQTKDFQKGEFMVPNLKMSYSIGKFILDFKPFFSGYNQPTFVSSMLAVFQNEDYNHEEFIQKLQSTGAPRLDFCQNAEQYRLLVEEIFNWRRRSKVNLRY